MIEIKYEKQGDYYMPNLAMEKEKIPTGKYALMRYNYLKNHKNYELTRIIMNKELKQHLSEIQKIATKRVNEIVEKLAIQENTTEELKAKDQMKWVALMNNYKMTAEEIVASELIYI